MSFDWQGRNEKGVLTFRGTSELPPFWFWVCYLLVGLLGGGIAAFGAVYWLLCGNVFFALLAMVPGLLWAVLIGGGIWWLNLRRHMQRLSPLDHLCALFGVDEASMRRVAMERDIQPQCNINGRDFYDPAEFGGAGILLRPSSPPENLLRPACNAATPPERLLRAADQE